jgi:hypothetical protein
MGKWKQEKSMAEPNKTQPSVEDIQRQIALIQLRKLEKEEAVEADRIAQANSVRHATAGALKQRMARDAKAQEMCTHRKENGTTRIVGVRASSGMGVLLACQNCAKEFDAQTCPPDLAPKAEHVGGPIMGYAS